MPHADCWEAWNTESEDADRFVSDYDAQRPLRHCREMLTQMILSIDDHPVLMDLWIEHLSTKADIPNYQLINGYQYIKFSAFRYFAMYLSKKEVAGIDYRELYNL